MAYRPEIRDHLILAPHKYSPAKLHNLIPANVRFSWPYSPGDAWNTNVDTGLYSFSCVFDTSFGDLNSWMLGSEFFRECPDMIGETIISDSFFDAWNMKSVEWGGIGMLEDFAGDVGTTEECEDNDGNSWAVSSASQDFMYGKTLHIGGAI
jgi:hypothetical protein